MGGGGNRLREWKAFDQDGSSKCIKSRLEASPCDSGAGGTSSRAGVLSQVQSCTHPGKGPTGTSTQPHTLLPAPPDMGLDRLKSSPTLTRAIGMGVYVGE